MAVGPLLLPCAQIVPWQDYRGNGQNRLCFPVTKTSHLKRGLHLE